METKKEEKTGGAIGALIGTVVLAVACAAGGWIARELWPQKPPQMPQMPILSASTSSREMR